jgi:demethylspheroidene O-methyltransferase
MAPASAPAMRLSPVADPARPPRWPSWRRMKIRLLASPSFQRWAAASPLMRRMTRGPTEALFDICAGFAYAQVLSACVRLHLFELLEAGPLVTQEIAHSLDMRPDAAGRLLRAAAALGLIEPAGGGRYALGTLGAAVLGNPGLAALIDHQALLYADLADPVKLLRREDPHPQIATFFPYAGSPNPAVLTPAQVASYSGLMASTNGLVADQVLAAYRIGRHTRLLDVGGGEGTFLRTAARRAPRLQLALFDLHAVVERARARLAAADLMGRAELHAGNFLHDRLPPDCDLISLLRVVQGLDDSDAMVLLRNVRRALPPGGTLLLAEPMAGARRAPRAADAYFGFYLMAMGSGRPRTSETLCDMLLQAGFTKAKPIKTGAPALTGLIVAKG